MHLSPDPDFEEFALDFFQLRPRLPGIPALRPITRRGNDWTGAGSQESSHPSRPSGRSPDMKRLSHWSQASAASCVSKRRMRSRRPSLHVSRTFQALPSSDLTTDQTA